MTRYAPTAGLRSAFESVARDGRYASRTLLKNTRFTALVVITLGLAIGASTTVFSVVNAVLFQPLPYAEGERLVWLWTVSDQSSLRQRASYPDFEDWSAATRTVELVGHGDYEVILTGTAEPERLRATLFVGDLFGVLGVAPLLGAAPTGEAAAVLSHAVWRRRFGSDPAIVGKAITLNGTPETVAAVMPAGFEFPVNAATRVDVWLPVERFNPALAGNRAARLIEVVGRLRPGVTFDEAQAEIDVIAGNLSSQYPATNRGLGVRLVAALDEAVGGASRGLTLFGASVAVLLLIGCANVANLLLARTLRRDKEIAMRVALGASRWHIARQLFLESLVLAGAGGLLGALLAAWGVEVLGALLADSVPRAGEVEVSAGVFGLAAALSAGAALLFGLAPAASGWKIALGTALQQGAHTTSRGVRGARLAAVLVTAQISLAMLLLAGAALFIDSFVKLDRPDAGFDPHNVLTFELSLPGSKYPNPAEVFERLRGRMLEIPGVVGASAGLQLPQRGDLVLGDTAPFAEIEGLPVLAQRPRVATLAVQPGFLETLGIPLAGGRDFGADDRAGQPPVAIVNRAFVRAYLSGADALGRNVSLDSWTLRGEGSAQIVGVVEDLLHRGLRTDVEPLVYLPFSQRPAWSSPFVVRTEGDPLAIVSAIREAVRAIDPEQPLDAVATLEQRLAATLSADRFRALLLGGFSALAVALVAIGLYSVLSYLTEQRVREVGIRMALGARAADVTTAVVLQGLKPVLLGMLLGLALAAALFRLVDQLLFDAAATSSVAWIAAVAILLIVAAVACAIPARRAARTDLVAVLRSE
jgi:predicted permease